MGSGILKRNSPMFSRWPGTLMTRNGMRSDVIRDCRSRDQGTVRLERWVSHP